MARRRRAEKRVIPPDPMYGSVDLARFIGKVMKCGKKTIAQGIVYGALDAIRQETKGNPLDLFNTAIKNATPLLQVKPRRVGGATYQVPMEVRRDRGQTLAMVWVIRAAHGRKGMPMVRKLTIELLEASKGTGTAVKRRDDLHRMAEANRAFAHYRW